MRLFLQGIFILFLSSNLLSQEADTRNAFFTFNVSSNFYFRQLGGALTSLNEPKYSASKYSFTDKNKNGGLFISAGSEFIFNVKKSNHFSYGFGLAYNYVKDYYTYFYVNRPYDYLINTVNYHLTTKNGNGELMNHLIRFVFSLNWTSKKNFTFYIRPLNYEMRFIQNKCLATTSEYQVTKKKIGILSYGPSSPPYYQYGDSTSTLINEYDEPIDFVRSVSFCFPTSLGIEQKFHLKKTLLNVGLSFSCSLLEVYYVPRVYVGICFGKFKFD